MVYSLWKNEWKTIFGLNTVILTKVKVKSINDVNITDRESNKLRGDEIMLCAVYVCNYIHDEILEPIFLK